MSLAWINEVFGWQRPNILTTPYQLIVKQAAKEMVALVLYFAENSAPDIHNDDFCRNILTDPDVVRSCSNIFFWAIGNCPESLEIQRALLQGNQSLPLLVAVTHDAFGRQMPPHTLPGLTDPQEVVSFICRAVSAQNTQLQARRDRNLREQQEREYQESLACDQERQRQRKDERQREEERKQRQREHLIQEERIRVEAECRNAEAIRVARAGLPHEPLESENTITLRIRGPTGNSIQRTFFDYDTTQVLFRTAFALLSLPSQDFVFHRHQGPSILSDGSSLSEISLKSHTVLVIEMHDESDP